MMNYVLTPLYSPFCCLFLQSNSTGPNPLPMSSDIPNPSFERNAEIKTKQSPKADQGQKIILTKQDLLRQGYQQVKKLWTEEEDSILLKLCKDDKMRFEEISRLIPNRNAKMCYSRYRRLIAQSKEYWTKAEDERLRDLVQEYGTNSWKSLVQHFPNRNFKQLKEHYENYLRPDLCIKEWTLEEDLQLIQLFNTYGREWQIIEKTLYWRSRNQLKNRLCSRILRLDAKKKEKSKGNNSIKQQVFTF